VSSMLPHSSFLCFSYTLPLLQNRRIKPYSITDPYYTILIYLYRYQKIELSCCLCSKSAVIMVRHSTFSWDRFKTGLIDLARILKHSIVKETISPVFGSLNLSFKF
jgi:hypothetical protein